MNLKPENASCLLLFRVAPHTLARAEPQRATSSELVARCLLRKQIDRYHLCARRRRFGGGGAGRRRSRRRRLLLGATCVPSLCGCERGCEASKVVVLISLAAQRARSPARCRVARVDPGPNVRACARRGHRRCPRKRRPLPHRIHRGERPGITFTRVSSTLSWRDGGGRAAAPPRWATAAIAAAATPCRAAEWLGRRDGRPRRHRAPERARCGRSAFTLGLQCIASSAYDGTDGAASIGTGVSA
jgi:hypothetical protein